MPKVQYGLSNVYVSKRTVTNNTVSYATPVKIEGGVNLTLEANDQENIFYADNIPFYVSRAMQGYTGELEIAFITDDFKKNYLGYKEDDNDNLVETNETGSQFALLFQFETDDTARKVALFNCSVGRPNEDHKTNEDTIEPQTSTLSLVIGGETVGDLQCYKKTAKYGDSNYSTFFTTVTVPTFTESV